MASRCSFCRSVIALYRSLLLLFFGAFFVFFHFAFSFFLLTFSQAQEAEQNTWTISASNQLEYSTDNKTHQDIFHDWTDLSLSYRKYASDLRYEAHQPDDYGRTWQGLSFRNLQMADDFLNITAGNYYVIFGRGLILRSYENRDLRFDNNLDGVKGTIDMEGFSLTLLGGTAMGKYQRLSDPIHAADGKVSVTDWMKLGASYLRTNITDLGLVRLVGGNMGLNLPHLDLYAEYAKKYNPPGEFAEQDGEGQYFSANLFTTGAGLTLEYKDYRRFDFSNQDVTFNNPPALTREHVYTLLNRHAHILNLSDEKGMQAEITSSPMEQLSVLANYSYTTNHHNDLVYSETYGEAEYNQGSRATLKAGFSRMEDREEDGAPYRLGPVADLTYYLSESNSVNFTLEHLWTSKYEGKLTYYDQILSLSVSHSPLASLTFTHERTTEWKTKQAWSGRKSWFITTLDLVLAENHNLSLGVGSRRKGKVCAGGICVDKPALDGFELKLLSRF
ncbi:MAG: DUF6029 family protein [Candidatus Zixiibacteriota bacterium]